jgi:hypothetical protein
MMTDSAKTREQSTLLEVIEHFVPLPKSEIYWMKCFQ